MGKGKSRDKGKGKKDKGKDKKDKRKGQSGKNNKESRGQYAHSCPHFKFINEQEVKQAFQSKTFQKSLSGKDLTKKENREISKIHPSVNWYNIQDLHLCLTCGKAVDSKHLEEHFKGNHLLALSFDDQSIHCLKCSEFLSIEPGTLCAELLGIDSEAAEIEIPEATPSESESIKGRGLDNLGNSCWMNSTLQILCRLPSFANIENGPLSRSLVELKSILLENGRSINPSLFARALTSKLDFLSVYEQHDAYEFLVLFLDSLRDEQGGGTRGLSSDELHIVQSCLSTPIDRVFGSIIQNSTACEHCGITTFLYQKTSIITLYVPIGGGGTSLIECFRMYFSESSANTDGERVCDKCGERGDCLLCPAIVSDNLPNILVVHLARFRMGKNGYVKNNVKVSVPEKLNINECLDNTTCDAKYKLVGFVSHSGTIDGGHYTSICRVGEQYVFFNDDRIAPISWNRAQNVQPYMIFYEKVTEEK